MSFRNVNALLDLGNRHVEATCAGKRHPQCIVGLRSQSCQLAGAFRSSSTLVLICRFSEGTLGPGDCRRVVAAAKCEAAELLEEMRALDGAAVFAQLLEA